MTSRVSGLVLRGVRIVPLDTPASPAPELTDVLIESGRIAAVGPGLDRRADTEEIQADGRWLIPGLWDQHVHFSQWVQRMSRFDLAHAESAAHTVRLVAEHLAAGARPGPTGFVIGWGFRTGTWHESGTVAALDAVTGGLPVVLISGDGHTGWLNSAALRRFGLALRDDPITETEWFDLYAALAEWPGVPEETEAHVGDTVARAARQGIVGIVDLEWARTWQQWQGRVAAGIRGLRVRTGAYTDRLEEVIEAGLRTGTAVAGTGGLVTMGPFKVIADGSLNTRTAWCCDPYEGDPPDDAVSYGAANQSTAELTRLVARAHQAGLEAALHAIGDRAVAEVLSVFAATGARGSIEHAQLIRAQEIRTWAGLPVRASVQPAHLLDDREATALNWPDRSDRCFALRELLDAGIEVALGSDAPVAPLDPWLAMAAAVHRAGPGQHAWHPEQSITAREALAASVDGARIRPGALADLVLLDQDPLAAPTTDDSADYAAIAAAQLRTMAVAATWVDGHLTWAQSSIAESLE